MDILQKLVAWELSHMRSDHQNSKKYSSIHNSKVTLVWNSRTSKTTSIIVSIYLKVVGGDIDEDKQQIIIIC